MTTLVPGSIILGSTRPDRLREWYLAALSPDPADQPSATHDGSGPIRLGGFILVIEGRDDVEQMNPQPGRVLINFHVEDFEAAERHLESVGVSWTEPVARRSSGTFGTFADPDGNLLQIIQFH